MTDEWHIVATLENQDTFGGPQGVRIIQVPLYVRTCSMYSTYIYNVYVVHTYVHVCTDLYSRPENTHKSREAVRQTDMHVLYWSDEGILYSSIVAVFILEVFVYMHVCVCMCVCVGVGVWVGACICACVYPYNIHLLCVLTISDLQKL